MWSGDYLRRNSVFYSIWYSIPSHVVQNLHHMIHFKITWANHLIDALIIIYSPLFEVESLLYNLHSIFSIFIINTNRKWKVYGSVDYFFISWPVSSPIITGKEHELDRLTFTVGTTVLVLRQLLNLKIVKSKMWYWRRPGHPKISLISLIISIDDDQKL